ncbi:MAG: chloride channel protein, partial [Pseudomonadota bacterium]
PAVHLGAMISSLPSRWLKLDIRATRTLIGCGAAAAVSASFHAPLAGLLFAREVVLQRYRIADIGPVAVSSVVAALAARAHFGEDSIFPPPDLSETPLSFFLITPLMGCLAAGLALVAIWTWIEAPKAGERLADRTGLPVWALPPLGGFAIGALALAFPQILGVGYEATASAIAGAYQPLFLIVLVIAKLAATAISLGSRFGNGVFSPSIYLGAMIGGAFGAAAGLALGDFETGRTFFTIVGMGAVSGAVLGAPISTTLIVFELTASYETAAAVLVSVSLATVLVQGVGGAIFERQLRIRMRER